MPNLIYHELVAGTPSGTDIFTFEDLVAARVKKITLTDLISLFPTGYTDEQAQDAVGTIFVDTDTIDFTYDDPTPKITADVRYQMSITSDASGIKLVNDATTPGNSKYYGTDSGGSKGFFALPSMTGIPINSLLAATGTNTIDNGNYFQEWQWNTLTENTGLKLTSSSTAAANDGQVLLNVTLTGANVTASQQTHCIYATNLHTGTGAINIAIRGKTSWGGSSPDRAFFGEGSNSNGYGFYGTGAVGVYGSSFAASGPSAVGVFGFSGVSSLGKGVYGEGLFVGVQGVANGATSTGVFGQNSNTGGYGVYSAGKFGFDKSINASSYTQKTTTYTATDDDFVIDCTSGNFTVNLPSLSSAEVGRMYVIRNSGGGTITVDPFSSATIDGALTETVAYAKLIYYTAVNTWITLMDASSGVPVTDTNFATTDLTATGNRVHTFADKTVEITYNTLGGASGFKISSTSTAASGGNQRLVEINLSGANVTSSQQTYGLWINNSHSGTAATNYGVYSQISNETSTSAAVYATANSGIGVQGNSSSGVGVLGGSTSNYGVSGSSTNVAGGNFSRSNASTNTVVAVLEIQRGNSGTSANGLGASLDYRMQVSNGTVAISNSIISKWTDATAASRTSQFIITGVNNAVTGDILTLNGNKSIQANGYGSGTFAGTPTFNLQVDASGNIIETGVVSGGDTNFAITDLTATGNRTHTFADKTVEITYNTLAGATGFKLSSTSTAAASNIQHLFDAILTGANSNNNQNTYCIYASNQHTGTGAINTGVYGEVVNGGTLSAGVFGNATTQIAVRAAATTGTGVHVDVTSGTGVLVTNTTGFGVNVTSGNGTPYFGQFNGTSPGLLLQIFGGTTASGITTVKYECQTSGTAAVGLGHMFDHYIERADGSLPNCCRVKILLTNAGGAGATEADYTMMLQKAGTLTDVFRIIGNGSILMGLGGARSTSATDGFVYIPTCAGPPVGTPTAQTDMRALIWDSTNFKLYIYDNGTWNAMN